MERHPARRKAVQAVQIDIAKFNIWLTNSAATNNGISYNTQCDLPSHKSHPIDSIYVYNAVPLTSTTLPAVRVVNGGILPSQTAPYGFTVATAMPLYVWGNYNASNSLRLIVSAKTAPPTPGLPGSWATPLPSFPPVGMMPTHLQKA